MDFNLTIGLLSVKFNKIGKAKNIMTTEVRLYQEITRKLIAAITQGKYPVGGRLPSERELTLEYEVSRPVVREALIALEVQGIAEIRSGSGAYVKSLPGKENLPGFNVTAFELTEARLLFEGEAAALAASEITDEELSELEKLVEDIALENQTEGGSEVADRDFHLLIAKATRNKAIYETIEQLWKQRKTSPDSALLYEKARFANIKPVVDEHSAILKALRNRDPNAARNAMRTHLAAVLDSLLFATEEKAIELAKKSSAKLRSRYAS